MDRSQHTVLRSWLALPDTLHTSRSEQGTTPGTTNLWKPVSLHSVQFGHTVGGKRR